MAEVLGVVSAVTSLASEGLKLSNALHAYYQKVKHAEEDVDKVSRDVRSVAAVLQELEEILKRDARLCSNAFYTSLSEDVDSCQALFQDIRAVLSQSKKRLGSDNVAEDQGMHVKDRLRWPFNAERVTGLRTDLDRCKLGVSLKIDVIRYKREVHEGQIAEYEREISKKENTYNVRIEKHNIEISKLKLEVAQERFRHMKTWAPFDQSAVGPDLATDGNSKEDKQKNTRKGATADTKNKRKETKDRKPGADPPARLGESLGRSKDSTGTRNKFGRDESNKKNTEAEKSDARAGKALVPSPVEAEPGTHDVPLSREVSIDHDQSIQRPVADGPINPADSATRASSNAKFESKGAVISNDDNLDKTEAGPSTSRPQRALLEQRDRSSDDDEVSSVVHSNIVDDANSTRSSAFDDRSTSATSIDYVTDDNDGAAVGSPNEEVGGSDTDDGILVEQQNDNLDNEIVTLHSGQNQPSERQQHDNLGSLNQKTQEISNTTRTPIFSRPKFTKLRNWASKARSGKTKEQSRRGRSPSRSSSRFRSSMNGSRRHRRPSPRSQSSASTAVNKGDDQEEPPAPRPPRCDPPRDPMPSQEPISANDSRWPSSSLFPLTGPSRPFEGRPYESRNVLDRVNCAMRPRYTHAQDTQTLHELWQFRQFISPQVQKLSWGHVTRDCLPLDESELQRMLKKLRKKNVPVARAFANLTSYQQRQIHLLILERASSQRWPAFRWTLQFVGVYPKKSKSSNCESIQVILERCLALGGFDSEKGGAVPDMPPRPRAPDIDPRYMPQDYMPQGYMPPPPPPMHRMVPPPPGGVDRPPRPYMMDDYYEPPHNVPRSAKGPSNTQYPRHRGSRPTQVALLEDDDEDLYSDTETIDSRYRSEPRARSGNYAYDSRPMVYYHSGIDDSRRGVRRSDPMIEVLEDRSYERSRPKSDKQEKVDRRKESERDKEERHKAEQIAIEKKIKEKREAERKEKVKAEETKRKRETEEQVNEQQRRELEHEIRNASEPRVDIMSYERSRDDDGLKRKGSGDSVDDLISKWTVNDDGKEP